MTQSGAVGVAALPSASSGEDHAAQVARTQKEIEAHAAKLGRSPPYQAAHNAYGKAQQLLAEKQAQTGIDVGLTGAEWAVLPAAEREALLLFNPRAPQEPRRVRPGPAGEAPIAIPLSDLRRTGTAMLDDPLSPSGKSLFFAAQGDAATGPVSLAAGRYEVIIETLGTDTDHDAVYVEMGGEPLRLWGGWGSYLHLSHEPTVVIAPEDGVYDLVLRASNELGVSVGRIHLIPQTGGSGGSLMRRAN